MIYIKRATVNFCLFSFGYAAYSAIELMWRRYTHFTMGIAGGLCFLILYRLYKKHPNLSLLKKCLIGSGIITTIEFIFGVFLNLKLGLDIWDYSHLPFNILGQICPLFSFFWVFLCIPVCYLSKKISKLENKLYKKHS